jgi:hypothetical protein
MRFSRLFRNVSVLVFLIAVMFQVPARASCGGDVYNQGGCGCSGWITLDFQGLESCEIDFYGCANTACQSECGGGGLPMDVGYIGNCQWNEWSTWYGFKCSPYPCEG